MNTVVEWYQYPQEKPTKSGIYYIRESFHDIFAKEYFWNSDEGVFYRMDFSIVDEKTSIFYWSPKKVIEEEFAYEF